MLLEPVTLVNFRLDQVNFHQSLMFLSFFPCLYLYVALISSLRSILNKFKKAQTDPSQVESQTGKNRYRNEKKTFADQNLLQNIIRLFQLECDPTWNFFSSIFFNTKDSHTETLNALWWCFFLLFPLDLFWCAVFNFFFVNNSADMFIFIYVHYIMVLTFLFIF